MACLKVENCLDKQNHHERKHSAPLFASWTKNNNFSHAFAYHIISFAVLFSQLKKEKMGSLKVNYPDYGFREGP